MGYYLLSLFNPMECTMALLSMGVSRQEYWNGLPFPSPSPPADLPDPGMEPGSPELQADSLPIEL